MNLFILWCTFAWFVYEEKKIGGEASKQSSCGA